MIDRAKTIKTLVVAGTIISLLTLSAHSQGLGKKGGGYRGPPVDDHPKVDDKAYNAALERIPPPKEKYDPWGIARPPEPANSGKKSN
jgi:hypothetical protein